MPYARRRPASRSSKKKTYSKKPRKVTLATVKKVAKSVVTKLTPKREIRFHNFGFFNTGTFSQSWGLVNLNNIALGTQDNQRTGDKIYMSGFHTVFAIRNTSGLPRSFRIIVLKDMNRNGDVLDITGLDNLFTDVSELDRQADGLVGDITSPINSNYKVFYHKQMLLEPEQLGKDYVFKKFIPLKQLVRYDNLGAQPTTPQSGNIRLLWKVEEFTSTPSGSNVQYEAFQRVYYRDA